MMLCVSTSTTSQEPFSTWSETQNQVRTKREIATTNNNNICVKLDTAERQQTTSTKLSGGGLTAAPVPAGIVVNGQVIGDKQIPPDGVIHTYFNRFGILHQALGVRLEVSTHDISVYQNNKWIKILWSEAASLKGTK